MIMAGCTKTGIPRLISKIYRCIIHQKYKYISRPFDQNTCLGPKNWKKAQKLQVASCKLQITFTFFNTNIAFNNQSINRHILTRKCASELQFRF